MADLDERLGRLERSHNLSFANNRSERNLLTRIQMERKNRTSCQPFCYASSDSCDSSWAVIKLWLSRTRHYESNSQPFSENASDRC